MKNRLIEFYRNGSGSFAPALALMSVPLLIAVGFAVDFSSSSTERSNMQNAADSAALAVAALPGSATDSERSTLLKDVYLANGGTGTVNGIYQLQDGKLTIQAKAAYDRPNFFAGFVTPQTPIAVAATVTTSVAPVPQKLDKVYFRLKKVTGWWSKKVTLYGKPAGQTSYKRLAEIAYQYNLKGQDPGYGTTTFSDVKADDTLTPLLKITCTGTTETTCSNTLGDNTAGAPIDVSKMDDLYLEMNIAGGFQATLGGLLQYIVGSIGLPGILKTNDPDAAQRLFVDGVRQARGTPVNIFSTVPCGHTSEQAWEDGGTLEDFTKNNKYDKYFLTNVAQADFFYQVQGKCAPVPGKILGNNTGTKLIR